MSALTIKGLTPEEISDAFDYLKYTALDTLKTKKVYKMSFSLDFEVGHVPIVTHEIEEYYLNEENNAQ